MNSAVETVDLAVRDARFDPFLRKYVRTHARMHAWVYG